MIDLYVGISETQWNKHPVMPGPLVCISPVYGQTEENRKENRIKIPKDCEVIQDSGAFSDGPGIRLSFNDALQRQIDHAEKYGYAEQVTHRASYDLLIDEVWTNGNRFKRRWTEQSAWEAVDETVNAARFISKNRNGLSLILSAQGVTANQYLKCSEQIVPHLQDGDIFGLGGWCITGKMPKVMMETFRETIIKVIPFVAKEGVKWIHIWGVCYAPALGELLWTCDQYNVKLSTDSAGPQLRPVRAQWGYMGWRDYSYKQPPVEIRGLERKRHVEATREWMANLRSTEFYREPTLKPKQLWLF